MAVGNIKQTAPAGPGNLQFLVARAPKGFIEAAAIAQSEVITTPGVNGRRWRTVNFQYPSTELYVVVDCPTYADAIAKKAEAERMSNALCSLTLVLAGAGYGFGNVHVDAVHAVAFPGPAVGEGATGLAHLVVVFSLTLTNIGA